MSELDETEVPVVVEEEEVNDLPTAIRKVLKTTMECWLEGKWARVGVGEPGGRGGG